MDDGIGDRLRNEHRVGGRRKIVAKRSVDKDDRGGDTLVVVEMKYGARLRETLERKGRRGRY